MNRYIVSLLLGLAASLAAQAAEQSEKAFTTVYRYNLEGQVTGSISPDPDGGGPLGYLATRAVYDHGLVSRVESGELKSWVSEDVAPANWEQSGGFTRFLINEYFYDQYGRKIQERVRRGGTGETESLVQFNYDGAGRVLCRAERMNRDAFASPPNACMPGLQGSYGPDRITRYTYDNLDQLLTEERGVGTALQQTYVKNAFAGRLLLSQTDANGNKTEYRYDEQKRLARRVYPSRGVPGALNERDYEEYTYEPTGNLKTKRTRNGQIITYTYDANNRVRIRDLSDNTYSPDVYLDYYPHGAQRFVRFGSSSGPGISDDVDAFGLLKSTLTNTVQATTSAGPSRRVSYEYDDNGNRTLIVHPDGQKFGYAYDGLNRICGVAEGAAPYCGSSKLMVAVSYRSDGERKAVVRGASVTTYLADGVGRLQQVTHDLPGTSNDLTNGFVYSPSNQINRMTQSNLTYAYVGNANRVGEYARNGLNQVTAVAGAAVVHDSNGNLTVDPGLSFSMTYDMENRLVGTRGAAAVTTALTYDPAGRLSQFSVGSSRTEFVYDGSALIAEYQDGALARRYVHSDRVDEPWVEYKGSTIDTLSRRYLLSDHQGSIITRLDSSGGDVRKLAYDSFGIPGASNDGRFGFTGQVWLRELGLYFYKARVYAPGLGRFLQVDPIGYQSGMNTYDYTFSDPLNHRDPFGLRATMEYIDAINRWYAEQDADFFAKPGMLEEFIPVWGSGKSAVQAFSDGQWGWGTWHTILAVTDLVPVKAAWTAFGKGAWKTGSHSWKATRRWLGGPSGGNFARSGQHVDHALFPRRLYENMPWKRWGEAAFNQKWNLKSLEPLSGYSMDQWHRMIDGRDVGMYFYERWWYRTPDWLKGAELAAAGDSVGIAFE